MALKVELAGGPKTRDSSWTRVSTPVLLFVEEQLKKIGYDKHAILYAEEAVKGTPARKGIEFRHVWPGQTPPSICIIAQPGNNSTCWKWRLQFPRDVNAQVVFDSLKELEPKEGSTVADERPFSAPTVHKPDGTVSSAIHGLAVLIETAKRYGEAKAKVTESEGNLAKLRAERKEYADMVQQLDEQIRVAEIVHEEIRRTLEDPDGKTASEALANLKSLI